MACVAPPAPWALEGPPPPGYPLGAPNAPPGGAAFVGPPPMPPYACGSMGMPMGMPTGPPMGAPMGSLPNFQNAPMLPQRPPAWIPPGAPMIPDRVSFPGQRQMDSASEDGPVSVACNNRPEVIKTGQMYPCPDTKTFLHRGLSRQQERELSQPGHASDICGWVMATAAFDDHATANTAEEDIMNIRHNDLRLVFQCLSGWALMHWRSQEDFEAGIYGARRAPRPLCWWDMRKAWDVQLEVGDLQADIIPYRVVVSTHSGNLYFLVELPETVPSWYYGIRGIIKDQALSAVKSRDNPQHQRKRWPAACGLAQALMNGQGVGERAMAIAFHLFDIDYDCHLQVGELMLLIRELAAGALYAEGRAEGQDRETAIFSATTRMNEEELFERALRFRRTCDSVGDGKVRKDDFILKGLGAMLEAVDIPVFVGGGDGQEAASPFAGIFE